MSKVIFTIVYSVDEKKRDEYLDIIRELKSLVKAEGLLSYSVYEAKNKKNKFEEIYEFESEQAYEDFDDNSDERIDILMSKLSDVILENTTNYSVMSEI